MVAISKGRSSKNKDLNVWVTIVLNKQDAGYAGTIKMWGICKGRRDFLKRSLSQEKAGIKQKTPG
jgi:hypothetical protein